ncbi:hypothetical protein T11_3687 [Trichinella zimbabwensis]|uniref:Uncharacterized protein n=1 Tax=Trichinella zimbabwensis TaxID=268475 RepID=A0A0V1GJ08_9BILA|nr:hypothetical protein T11_3687 [Trichinella zimbabwensis]
MPESISHHCLRCALLINEQAEKRKKSQTVFTRFFVAFDHPHRRDEHLIDWHWHLMKPWLPVVLVTAVRRGTSTSGISVVDNIK